MNLTIDTRPWKQNALDAAEIFDAWRVVPRVMLFMFALWFGYFADLLVRWYMALPIAAQTAQASAFCFGCFGAMTTMAGYTFKIYTSGGRVWDQSASVTQTVASTTVTK